MKCPVDETVLVMSERQGVEIDYCPQCRGVWLDRGELDKLIDRADDDDDRRYDERSRDDRSRDDRPRDDRPRDDRPRDDRPRYDAPRHEGGYPKHKKKKSFLGEFFEFGD